MKNYVVGALSLFEYELKQFKIQAENEYEAVKKAMVEMVSKEEYKQDELDWQASPEYPKNYLDLKQELINCDLFVNVIEV